MLATFSEDHRTILTNRASRGQGIFGVPMQACEAEIIDAYPTPIPLEILQIVDVGRCGWCTSVLDEFLKRPLQLTCDHLDEAKRQDQICRTVMDQHSGSANLITDVFV
jgi:hypothetical protein